MAKLSPPESPALQTYVVLALLPEHTFQILSPHTLNNLAQTLLSTKITVSWANNHYCSLTDMIIRNERKIFSRIDCSHSFEINQQSQDYARNINETSR